MSAMASLLRELDTGLDEILVRLHTYMDSNTADARDYALYTQVLIAKAQLKQALDVDSTALHTHELNKER